MEVVILDVWGFARGVIVSVGGSHSTTASYITIQVKPVQNPYPLRFETQKTPRDVVTKLEPTQSVFLFGLYFLLS